jgi:ribosome-binding factor A
MDPVARGRLNAGLRELVAELLAERVRDPRVEGVTVTGVEVTRDLAVAKVYYSVLGDAEAQRVAQRGLENVSGYLRREAGRRMRLRSTPELRFVFDASLERGARLEELLRDIHAQDERTEPGEPEDG